MDIKVSFFLCYENVVTRNYISEKLAYALFGGAIPIILGRPMLEIILISGVLFVSTTMRMWML